MPPRKKLRLPTDPEINLLRQEVIDLRQRMRMQDITIDALRRAVNDLSVQVDERIDNAKRQFNILNETVKAIGAAQIPAQIIVLGRHIDDVRKMIVALTEARGEQIHELEARITELESADLLTHQRLHSLEGGRGLEPPKPLVKGGWINVFHMHEENGTPNLDACGGPYPTREDADQHASVDSATRLACLYLQGEEIQDQ